MMKIVTEFNNNIDYNKYFNSLEICFIDIETTGLSSNYNSIYLIGLLYYNKSKGLWTLVQLFANNISQEYQILIDFINIIKNFDSIITYNGDTFDIPFINKRLELLNINYNISKGLSLDLYKVVKENRYYLNLENLKLKTLEKSIGVFRDDIYSGKECIGFYKDYVDTNNEESRSRILKHNYDDLYYMLNIIEILDIIDEKKTFFIDYKDYKMTLKIDSIDTIGDTIILKGYYLEDLNMNLIHYDNNYSIIFGENNQFELSMEYSTGLVSAEEKAMFVDKNKLALSNHIIDSTNYNVAENVILLKIEKKFSIENIKAIVCELITNSLIANLY